MLRFLLGVAVVGAEARSGHAAWLSVNLLIARDRVGAFSSLDGLIPGEFSRDLEK